MKNRKIFKQTCVMITITVAILLLPLMEGERNKNPTNLFRTYKKMKIVQSKMIRTGILTSQPVYLNPEHVYYSYLVRNLTILEEAQANMNLNISLARKRFMDLIGNETGVKKGHLYAITLEKEDIVPYGGNYIPMVIYHAEKGAVIHYNPETVGWFALAAYEDYMETNSSFYRRYFFKCVDWIITHLVWRAEYHDYDAGLKLWLLRSESWSEPFQMFNDTYRVLNSPFKLSPCFAYNSTGQRCIDVKIVYIGDLIGQPEIEVYVSGGRRADIYMGVDVDGRYILFNSVRVVKGINKFRILVSNVTISSIEVLDDMKKYLQLFNENRKNYNFIFPGKSKKEVSNA